MSDDENFSVEEGNEDGSKGDGGSTEAIDEVKEN